MKRVLAAAGLIAASIAMAGGVAADPPSVSIRAGKSDSLNHELAVQFGEAIATGTNGALTVVVEESQGSVQNIIDAAGRGGAYIFTAPPDLIAQARRGDKPFRPNQRYRDIRALFPIPPLTFHWLVRADSGVKRFADLAGKRFVPGAKGSFAEQQTVSVLHALGLDARVQLIDIDAAGAPAALQGNQVIGLALAGPYPMPQVTGLARAVPLRLLSLAPGDLKKVLAADDSTITRVIPGGTYPGIDEDVVTIALPTGAYTTTRMSDATAYAVTKAFWSQKSALGERNPPWAAVTPGSLTALRVKLHAGALRYYREAGIRVPASLR